MKFTLSILALLAIAFLVGCSAKDTSNKSELNNKYGGIYIFNKKFYDEIEKQEQIRDNKRKEILERIKTIPNKNERNKKMREILKLEFYDNPKMQQTLSNGKQYYLRSEYAKKVVIPDDVIAKLKNFMGEAAYNRSSIMISDFYIDDEKLKVISLDINFYEGYTKYGLFGDEGRGFSLSRKDIRNVSSLNRFILNNNKFEKVK